MSNTAFSGHGGCAVVSIETLQRRRDRQVDWNHVMNHAQQAPSSLQFLLGANDSKTLVLVRNYGAKTVVVLSDLPSVEHKTISMTSKSAPEFLVPYVDGIVATELNDQYDELQAHLAGHGLELLGPLDSARAAYAMKYDGLDVGAAIDFAHTQSLTLSSQQAQRIGVLKDLGIISPEA